MDIETLAGLVAVFALVLANGFFVATEFAIVARDIADLSSCVTRVSWGWRCAKDC